MYVYELCSSATDGGVVKECMSAVAETLLEGIQKQELCDKNKANTHVSIICHKEVKY